MRHLLALAAPLLVALPLGAQQHAMPRDSMRGERQMMHQMMHMGGMMAPMMRVLAYTPAHLLTRSEALGLTAQQTARLTDLRDAAKTAHDAAVAEAKGHMEPLQQAWRARPTDTAGVRAHFQALHDGLGNAHWSMLGAAAQARSVLTDEQRGRVEGWTDVMLRHEHMGGRERSGGGHQEH